jgi:peptidoglycan/xylan/chitin deacetylase (PgdA/CDA1 family)
VTLIPFVIGVHPSGGSWGWERILRQEGLPFEVTEEPLGQVSVFAGTLPASVEGYVSSGGVAVVSGASEADGLLPVSELAALHRFRVPDGAEWAEAPGIVRLFPGDGWGELRLHEDRKVKGGSDPDVFAAVLVREVGAGAIVWTGIPLTDLLEAAGDRLRRFSRFTDVTERVSSVDKAEVAETLVWMLRAGFGAAGLPYVRPARFPKGARSILVFRIDVDGIFGDRAARLAAAASAAGVRLSFFFNGSLAEEHPGDVRDAFAPHEVGHHGYLHNVFDDVRANIENLERGAEWVRRTIGVEPDGFVAPRGLWNRALEEALVATGHMRSGDFALEFDSLPFRTSRGVLQIPVHPYSPERAVAYAEDAGLPSPTPQVVTSHYLAVLEHHLGRNRPFHVYGHPEVLGAMADDVIPSVGAAAGEAGITSMTVSEYAAWWERREDAGMALSVDRSSAQVDVSFQGEPFVVEAFTTRPATVHLGSEEWQLPGGGEPTVLIPASAGSGPQEAIG